MIKYVWGEFDKHIVRVFYKNILILNTSISVISLQTRTSRKSRHNVISAKFSTADKDSIVLSVCPNMVAQN